MDIEDFFEEWDEDKDDNDLAELLEDNVRAVNTIEAEDSEDEDESESEDYGSTFKCSKCKKRYHLKAWLQKHENSCSGKEPTKKCKVKLSEHQKKTRKVLSSLGFDDFFTSKCVPSLITFLNKISATSSETAKIRGSRFTHAQQQAGKDRAQKPLDMRTRITLVLPPFHFQNGGRQIKIQDVIVDAVAPLSFL